MKRKIPQEHLDKARLIRVKGKMEKLYKHYNKTITTLTTKDKRLFRQKFVRYLKRWTDCVKQLKQMKTVKNQVDESLDLIATNETQVEIQKEIGFVDKYKLYVHHQGKTVVRVCKLKDEQFDISALL